MSEQNKALARRFYEEVFNRKNPNAIDELCAPDFIDRSPMPGQAPGRDGVKKSFAMYLKAFGDMRITVHDRSPSATSWPLASRARQRTSESWFRS